MHALDVEALADPGLAFVSLRRDGELLGVGALKVYGDRLGELKSMHTVQAARGQGVASAIVEHLLGLAEPLQHLSHAEPGHWPDGTAGVTQLKTG